MLPPVADSFELPDLLRAVAREDRCLDLRGAMLHSGWENVVVQTGDGWILRFPRDADLAFERELAILGRLQGRLPVSVPRVEWTGAHTRFAAYRALTGSHFDRADYFTATEAERDRVAGTLAEFLAAMHSSLSDTEIAELGISAGSGDPLAFIEARIDRIAERHRAEVEVLMERYRRTWAQKAVGGPTVPLHNDFHCDNLVLDGPMGRLCGVWDFSCVQLGVPSFDFRYFDGEPRDLMERLGRHYAGQTGRVVDLPAATTAYRIECISDALECGEDLDETVTGWRRADAGL